LLFRQRIWYAFWQIANATSLCMRPLVFAAALAATTSAAAAEFKLGPHTFTLPDGFTIEVAAPSSLVPRPNKRGLRQARVFVSCPNNAGLASSG
jgi:hypothetical protein